MTKFLRYSRKTCPIAARGGVSRRIRAVASTIVFVLVFGACSSGGSGSGSFEFSSPGNTDIISYPLTQRGTVSDLSGPSLTSDEIINLSDYVGTVVVLNFWGSWCPPCRAEAGELNAAARALESSGVQFLGVDIRDSKEAGRDFHQVMDTPYPSIFDPTMQTLLSLRGFPTAAIPSTIVLDRQHRVAHIWLRPVTETQLIKAITPIAAEPESQ